jgi:hypothetical protein
MDRPQNRKISGSRKTAYLLVGLLAGLLIPLLAVFLARRIQPILPGATAIKLVRGCQATLMDKSLQPVFTVSLDCPGVDSIRIWPLPIIQPFMEDWKDGLPGDLEAKTDLKLDIKKDIDLRRQLWTVG